MIYLFLLAKKLSRTIDFFQMIGKPWKYYLLSFSTKHKKLKVQIWFLFRKEIDGKLFSHTPKPKYVLHALTKPQYFKVYVRH